MSTSNKLEDKPFSDKEPKPKRKPSDEAKEVDAETTVWEEKARPVEIVSLDIGEEGATTTQLDEETTLDLLQDAREEIYGEKIDRHTNDEAVREALKARQDLNTGQERLLDKLEQHHAKSPDLSAGDVDAAWDAANVGEETVGGMTPTPDQDVVEEIGEAMGISYQDDEPLQTGEKLAERDRQRWELDPESAEEEV